MAHALHIVDREYIWQILKCLCSKMYVFEFVDICTPLAASPRTPGPLNQDNMQALVSSSSETLVAVGHALEADVGESHDLFVQKLLTFRK